MDYSRIFTARANRYREAQVRWPDIRRAELECFAGLLKLRDEETVLDAPAGSGVLKGYLPESCGYHAQDPADDFAEACRAQWLPVCHAPLRSSGLAGCSFDVVASLTGLHHERQREEIYAEWWRLLKPGGRLVIMDVAAGSPVGAFLNGFVDRWNSQGHEANFLDQADELALTEVGFVQVRQVQCEYSWCAVNQQAMAAFMLDLFGLDLQPAQQLVVDTLEADLDAGWRQGCYQVPWGLTALLACKPAPRHS